MVRNTRCRSLLAACAAGWAGQALAQEVPLPPDTPLPAYAQRIALGQRGGPAFSASTNGLPNVLLTGYWPPTNEMLRQFSANPDQNSNGWVGENWEGRGYNVHAFFPEFPGGVLAKGEGDFEVDYQDTSSDWWPLLDAMDPIAIVTFSRAGANDFWEPEGGNRTYALNSWTNDYLAPLKPTPELPIAQEIPLTERFSTLPIAEIMHNVSTSGAAVTPIASVLDTSAFLSNFIGYHGVWYRDLHADATDPDWVVCAGHVHAGFNMDLAAAVLATEVTVRTVLAHVDDRRALVSQGDINGDGTINLIDYSLLADCVSGPAETLPPEACESVARFALADLNADTSVDLTDFSLFAHNYVALAEPGLELPFAETFAGVAFDPARWALVASATIDEVGTAEPSAPYSARLNKSPTGADQFTSRPIDTRSATPVHLYYGWQRRGGGDSPEAGDDLLVEYQDVLGDWHLLAVHLGAEADMTTFQLDDLALPSAALHDRFRLRFRSAFGSAMVGDDWFVDDVLIAAE